MDKNLRRVLVRRTTAKGLKRDLQHAGQREQSYIRELSDKLNEKLRGPEKWEEDKLIRKMITSDKELHARLQADVAIYGNCYYRVIRNADGKAVSIEYAGRPEVDQAPKA